MNSWTIWGYVKRAESRVTTTGKALTKFTVSVPNEKRPNQEKAGYTYVDVTYWGALNLVEGQQIMAHGAYASSSYDKKDGTKGYNHGMNARKVGLCEGGKVASLHDAGPGDDVQDIPF